MMMIDGTRGYDGMIYRLAIVGSIEPRAVLKGPTVELVGIVFSDTALRGTLYNIMRLRRVATFGRSSRLLHAA